MIGVVYIQICSTKGSMKVMSRYRIAVGASQKPTPSPISNVRSTKSGRVTIRHVGQTE